MRYLLFIIILFNVNVYSQESVIPWISPSPKGEISQIIGNTLIEIEYERPSVRKRQIFGGLVPWNKLWRTGAGSSTKIKFDKTVKIGGQFIPSGHYSLLTIPNPNEWIVILNKDHTLNGTYGYDIKKDMVRFVVIPTKSNRFYETLNIDLDIHNHNSNMYISWENTQISFKIETTTNELMDKLIKEYLLTEKSKNPEDYTAAASYLNFMGTNYNYVIQFADKAFELDNSLVYTKIWKKDVYIKLHQYEKAIQEITEIIKIKEKENDKDSIKRLKEEYDKIGKLIH